MIKIYFNILKKTIVIVYCIYGKILDASSLNSGHIEDCEDKKLQQSDLTVSFTLDALWFPS